jgi:tol-pal system protein YbgF
METVVTDMHERVTLLDKELEPSLAALNENAAALIQRVNENERQVRLLTSLIEENQHKLDNLLKMISDLRTTLYRHWGLNVPVTGTSGTGDGIRIVPPVVEEAPDEPNRTATSEGAPPLSPTPTDAGEGRQAYSDAKGLYDNEEFAAAEGAFASFMKNYPRSTQGHKAQFWLGKCLLSQSQYSRAITAFETLRREYPESSYMAFALHNQAVGHFRLGEKNTAIALMEEVVDNYPSSTAADHAARDLKQLRGRQ